MSLLPLARALLLANAAAAALNSGAQPAPPDPSIASAPVPRVSYTSAFAGYRPFADDAMTPWRQANDTAAGIGGWRVYAREARQPTPASALPAASAAHGAHGSK